jgi:hypothetical protein
MRSCVFGMIPTAITRATFILSLVLASGILAGGVILSLVLASGILAGGVILSGHPHMARANSPG